MPPVASLIPRLVSPDDGNATRHGFDGRQSKPLGHHRRTQNHVRILNMRHHVRHIQVELDVLVVGLHPNLVEIDPIGHRTHHVQRGSTLVESRQPGHGVNGEVLTLPG